MPLLNWSDSYRTGNAEIDREHECLFKILNELYETVLEGAVDDVRISVLFRNVLNFTKIHFRCEEALLASVQYPDLAVHRQQHQRFSQQLEAYRRQDRRTQAETLAIAKYIMGWLVRHMLDSDMLYRMYLLERNHAPPQASREAAAHDERTRGLPELRVRAAGTFKMAGRSLPTFYFDLTRMTEASRLRPEDRYRMIVVCHHYVHRTAPQELFIPMENGFCFVVQTRAGAQAERLARELHDGLLQHLLRGRKNPQTAKVREDEPFARRGSGAPARNDGTDADNAEDWNDVTFVRTAKDFPPPRAVGAGAFALKFLPIFDLKTGVPASYICGPVLREANRTLFGDDITRYFDSRTRFEYDMRTLDICLSVIAGGILPKAAMGLCVRVNFETLTWSKMRQTYQGALQAAKLTEDPRIGLMIDGIPAGTPSSRIVEAVASLRPFAKRISLHLPERDAGIKWTGKIGVAGVAAFIPRNAAEAETAEYANRLKKTAASQNAESISLGETDVRIRNMLRSIGIRYAIDQKLPALTIEDLPQAFANPPDIDEIPDAI